MKNKKGGYSVKNGFYIKNDIKNDCKNNDEDGSIDEDGYILDPLTYDRIKEGNLIQLSDGICYEKSKNLSRAIKNRNTLPFGHVVTSGDKKKLSSSSSVKSFSPDQELEDVLIRQPSSPEEEEFEITPVRRRRRPVQINIPATRRRPPGSRNRTTRQRPILLIESDSPEVIGNSGRGTKKRKLKRKSKGKSKRKSK
jgi:hypothetical protein